MLNFFPISFISELDRTVVSLVRGGITANSRAAYSTAVKKYAAFCRIYSLSPIPVSQSNALRFVAHCANSGLAVSSIRVYLAGLRSWSIDMGLPPPEIYSPHLTQAIRCLDRHHTPAQAPPLLHHHLLSIFSRAPFNKDNLMSITALSLAYFACLRPSEYLTTRGTAPPPPGPTSHSPGTCLRWTLLSPGPKPTPKVLWSIWAVPTPLSAQCALLGLFFPSTLPPPLPHCSPPSTTFHYPTPILLINCILSSL